MINLFQFKKYNRRFLFARANIFILILIICGCAGQIQLHEGEEKRVSGEELPGWVFQPGQNFETGTSQPCATEADARSAAMLDARKKIIDRIGVMLTKEQQERIYNQAGAFDDNIVSTTVEGDIQTAALSRGLIAVKAQKFHVEKYARKKYDEISYFFLAYVHVPFSKTEHDAFINESFQEIKKRFNSRYARIRTKPATNVVNRLNQIVGLEQVCRETRKLVGLKPELTTIIDEWEAQLAARKTDYQSAISMIPIGKDQPIGADNRLNQKIGIRVLHRENPVAGVTVTLVQDNIEITRGVTDENGYFFYNYTEPIIGEVSIVFQSSLDGKITLHPIHFIFQNQIKIIVRIPELAISTQYTKNYVEHAVISSLLENKIQVNQSCQLPDELLAYLVAGNFSALPDSGCLRENLLFTGRAYAYDAHPLALNNELFSAQAAAELKLFDPKSNAVLWNITLTENRGLGASLNDAGDNALRKLAETVRGEVALFFSKQLKPHAIKR